MNSLELSIEIRFLLIWRFDTEGVLKMDLIIHFWSLDLDKSSSIMVSQKSETCLYVKSKHFETLKKGLWCRRIRFETLSKGFRGRRIRFKILRKGF